MHKTQKKQSKLKQEVDAKAALIQEKEEKVKVDTEKLIELLKQRALRKAKEKRIEEYFDEERIEIIETTVQKRDTCYKRRVPFLALALMKSINSSSRR